jgi:hypothetical protein
MRKVARIATEKVRGGARLTAYCLSPRGTYFAVGSEEVLRAELGTKTFAQAKGDAIARLLSRQEQVPS